MSRRKTKPPHRARLENEVAFLRKELERKDAILLNMTEGLKSLEAPREVPESPESASETSGSRVLFLPLRIRRSAPGSPASSGYSRPQPRCNPEWGPTS